MTGDPSPLAVEMNRVWTYLQIEHPDSASEDGKHLRFERDLKDVPPLARFQKVVTTWRDGMYLKILEKQANLVTDDQDGVCSISSSVPCASVRQEKREFHELWQHDCRI